MNAIIQGDAETEVFADCGKNLKFRKIVPISTLMKN